MADGASSDSTCRLPNISNLSNIIDPDESSVTEDASNGKEIMFKEISWEDIAAKLLRDKFLLTALELHAELLESGLELPRLRDYFSNPGNFERAGDLKVELSPGLPRTSSIQTFDSLDFARYSDDGDRQVDERVAVLEFELRKARETIRSLRANLTEAAESEVTTPESYMSHCVPEDPIKPHEKRAVNFLVNEYMLKCNYKLTSITFSDENEDQDFEDWDDVGLNVPKPPSLLVLYRDFSRQIHPNVNCVEIGVQVDLDKLSELNFTSQNANDEDLDGLSTVNICAVCGAIRSTVHNPSSYQMSDFVPGDIQLNKIPAKLNTHSAGELDDVTTIVDCNLTRTVASCSTDDSLCKYLSEERSWKTVEHPSIDKLSESDDTIVSYITEKDGNAEDRTKFVQIDDDFNEVMSCNLSSVSVMQNLERAAQKDSRYIPSKEIIGGQRTTSSFLAMLLDLCHGQKAALNSRLALEVSKMVNSSEKVVLMLARCLPYIVPNVILAKREELIPVILCTISLHPDSRERDKLLNILFNLIKRPDNDQRMMILTGFVAIAQFMGPTRVESELLPQCWEQINHKYPERRLLVAEACGVLMPYIPNEIRSSLVLSMLQQMLLDDKSDVVRVAVVKSLAVLFAFVDDTDKYSQGLQLLIFALHDSSEKVVGITTQLFLHSFASWTKSLDRLEKNLVPSIVKNLEDKICALPQSLLVNNLPVTLSGEEQNVINLINALQSLLPWLFVSVLETVPFTEMREELHSSTYAVDIGRFPPSVSPLCDVCLIVGSEHQVSALIDAYENYIAEEWYETWARFDWLTKSLLPDLLKMLVNIGLSCQPIIHSLSLMFYWICRIFGHHFTNTKVKPLFTSTLKLPREDLDTLFGKNVVNQAIVPVYCCGVLAAFNHDNDRVQLTTFLQELLSMLSLWYLPLDSIKVTIIELRSSVLFHDILLSVLWDGVVHTSALVRCSAAKLFHLMVGHISDSLLSARVAPALVTLANDPEISVRIATVPTFGAIMELTTQRDLLAKAQMQLQMFLDDAMYKDQYTLHQEIIRTFGHIAPNCQSKFRDEFILPHLVALASHNNRLNNESKRAEIARALLDTFVSISCCFLSDELIFELVIPALRCLHYDIQQLVPEHEEGVIAMVHEFESKITITRPADKNTNAMGASASTASMDDVRNRVSKMFNKTPVRPNIQNIFQLRKK